MKWFKKGLVYQYRPLGWFHEYFDSEEEYVRLQKRKKRGNIKFLVS